LEKGRVKLASYENGEDSSINQAQHNCLAGVTEVVGLEDGLHLAEEQLDLPSGSIKGGCSLGAYRAAIYVGQIEAPPTVIVADSNQTTPKEAIDESPLLAFSIPKLHIEIGNLTV
jgi:hypothetical protein